MTAHHTILTAVLGISLVLAGCATKQKQPQPAATPAATAAPKDSADIFTEFYSDSAVAMDKAKAIKTFSLSGKKSAPVKGEDQAAGSYTPAFSDNGPFVVQVATVAARILAEELALEMKEKGYPSYVLEVQNPTTNLTGTYYRVRIGRFATSDDAKAFGENILVPAKFGYWVVRKSTETSSPLESSLDQGSANYGSSGYTPPPAYTPPPEPAYTPPVENVIVPGPGTAPSAPPSSSGGWQDTATKW